MTDIDTKQDVFWVPESQCRIVEDERDRLKADLAVRDENYATLLKRWKEATQDLAIFRAENQRPKDLTGD